MRMQPGSVNTQVLKMTCAPTLRLSHREWNNAFKPARILVKPGALWARAQARSCSTIQFGQPPSERWKELHWTKSQKQSPLGSVILFHQKRWVMRSATRVGQRG